LPETPPTQSSRLWRVLKRPLWKTVTIPDGARVDPDRFSEDEFPVRCLTCGYLLRGLLAGRCPECGEEFERGHLLVEQYVRGRQPKSDWRFRVATWCFAVGLVLVLGSSVILYFILRTLNAETGGGFAATRVVFDLLFAKMAGLFFNTVGFAFLISTMCRNKAKKRHVLAAIEQEDNDML